MENNIHSPGVASNSLGDELAQFLDQNMDANMNMADFSNITFDSLPSYPQTQYPVYSGFPNYVDVQDSETRKLLLLLLSRLDTVERIVTKVDDTVGKLHNIMDKVKNGLHEFSQDMISVVQGCGFFDGGSDTVVDEELGVSG